ncbi:hypothetical protein B9J77_02150 [candidate division NPL-UPA2 bacterium Unc8]|uniref:Uncharacterized protein n=2 Tax=Bacteria TaxID=2 RepID=A0A9E2F6W4_PSYF1|nr:hypothetical protein [Candidatus Psychracetigena formicireducens]MBT9146956.1 hypothetical protein [Bacillota bacterium]RII00551.1 MAG: hypothetical protein B9J77_02150 [candidate division NPL-UPA2 bacterium Unc8]
MVIAVRVFGIVAIAMGIIFLLNPMVLKQIMTFTGQGKRFYAIGALRLLIGGMLLYAASQSRLPVAIIILGILALASGIAIFTFREKIESMLNWFNKKSLLSLRFLGFIPLAIGALLLYSA